MGKRFLYLNKRIIMETQLVFCTLIICKNFDHRTNLFNPDSPKLLNMMFMN